MTRVKGVVFDIDGTLVDSNDQHARAWVQALREDNLDVPFEKIRPLIGMGGDKLLPEVTGLLEDSPRGKQISERRGAIFKEEYLPRLRAFPQTRALLLRLRDRGFKLGVASSAQADELGQMLRIAEVADLMEDVASGSEAKNSKPDPDVLHAALSKLGLEPAHAVMVGDTPYDIEAAHKAGMRCIALRCGGWHNKEHLATADAVYADPADLLMHLEDSPLSAKNRS